MELCDRVLARDASTTYPLGMGDRLYIEMTHDGMKVYIELVDWKNR